MGKTIGARGHGASKLSASGWVRAAPRLCSSRLSPTSRPRPPPGLPAAGKTLDKTATGLTYIPAPKLKLPGHEESYNPPAEYLPTEASRAGGWPGGWGPSYPAVQAWCPSMPPVDRSAARAHSLQLHTHPGICTLPMPTHICRRRGTRRSCWTRRSGRSLCPPPTNACARCGRRRAAAPASTRPGECSPHEAAPPASPCH